VSSPASHLRSTRDRKALFAALGVVLLAAVLAYATGACRPDDPRLRRPNAEQDASSSSLPSTTVPPTDAASPPSSAGGTPAVPDGPTTVAQARADLPGVDVFDAPGATTPTTTVENPGEYGNPQVFVVVEPVRDGFVHVLLPIKPNGSHGWVRETDVTLAQHEYRIDVSLSGFRMKVRNGDETVLEAPIGVGTSDTPTPAATYYTWVLLAPTNSGYGQYAYGLSGFSDVLDEFAGGDARLGIHGTDDESSIGRNVSHGCIRITDETVVKMVEELQLPLGVPVTVTA
jgi:lipoprotein-anchoring transpeptidase ErfK/SrfK